MRRAFVIKGRLIGERTVTLAEPVDGVEVEVEVIVREAQKTLPPPEDTESPVAKFRRDVVDAALSGKAPHVEVVYEGEGRDVSTDTGMIVARRSRSDLPKRDEADDTNPDMKRPSRLP